MHIAVFGTGGVGGYFGGRLAQAGEDVTFIARGEHLKAIQKQGLRVDSIKGDFVIHPAKATDQPAEAGLMDVIIVGVKSWQMIEAAEAMQPMVGPDTFVVPLLNGVEAADQAAAVLGKEHVVGGLCRIVSFIAGPGHIRHTGIEPSIAFGELDDRPSERCHSLLEAFRRAGVQAEIPNSILSALWEKFLFIASYSGVGAVTGAPAGPMRSIPETRKLIEEAMQEVAAVAKARGVNLSPDVVSRTMATIDGFVEGSTASMQRDILAGRPSELEAQNGSIVRLGEAAGVPTPTHRFLYGALLPMELRARGKVRF